MTEQQQEVRRRAKIMMAFAEGKKILCRKYESRGKWEKNPNPLWNWMLFDYKVAPETVKVRLFKSEAEPDFGPVVFVVPDDPIIGDRHPDWVPCSDIIEIEVKDVPQIP